MPSMQANITTNRNTVPGETRSPFQTSGLRLGTPAVTTRGMREPEMARIAEAIDIVLGGPTDPGPPRHGEATSPSTCAGASPCPIKKDARLPRCSVLSKEKILLSFPRFKG